MDPPIPEPPGSPRLLRPRGVGEILTDAFRLYRLHWQSLIAIVAVVVVPLTLLQALVTEVIGDTFVETRIRAGVEIHTGEVAGAALAALAVAVLSILTWSVLTGAITRAAAGTFLGRDLQIEESYRYGLARLGSIILVGLLVALAVIGGLILFVIPGIIVATRLSCSIAALVVEDKRGREALRRSWNLVKGFGWRVFGAFLFSGLLAGLASSLLTLPFGRSAVGRAIGQTIASVITLPYGALVGILIYLDLRVRKERYTSAELERDLASTATP
jgi:hypothetical protein